MISKDKTSWTRVLVFTVAYLSLFAISAFLHTVNSLSGSPELQWYLERPLQTAIRVVEEVTRNPLMMFTLAQLIAYPFILGLLTEWVYRATKAYAILKLRQRSMKRIK
ncbi:MAG: hypothetical protein QXJ17_00995 [Nitrososphaeria archaeon]